MLLFLDLVLLVLLALLALHPVLLARNRSVVPLCVVPQVVPHVVPQVVPQQSLIILCHTTLLHGHRIRSRSQTVIRADASPEPGPEPGPVNKHIQGFPRTQVEPVSVNNIRTL